MRREDMAWVLPRGSKGEFCCCLVFLFLKMEKNNHCLRADGNESVKKGEVLMVGEVSCKIDSLSLSECIIFRYCVNVRKY